MHSKRLICIMLLLALFIALFPAQQPVYAASAANIADGAYTIYSSLGTTKVIDIKDRSTANGNNVQLYDANATTAQVLYVKHISNGYYAIVMAGAQNKALDIHGGSGYSGANVEIYTYHGGDNQLWKFVPTGNANEYYIVSKSGGFYLDVSGGNTTNSTNIQVYSGNQSKAQRWKLKENYNVSKAVDYALKYTDSSAAMTGTYNSKDYNMYKKEYNITYRGYDCTNYASQCLYAGGLIETSGWGRVTKGKSVNDVKGGVTWVQAASLYPYLKDLGYHTENVKSDLSNIHLGDIVFFDFDGNGTGDHATICTNVANGKPKYSAHSSWRKNFAYSVSHWKNSEYPNGKAYVIHMSFCTQSFANTGSTVSFFPACAASCTTITQGLQNIGVDSSYSYRQTIAVANQISGYSGTTEQNTQMLNLLKAGKLIKPGSSSAPAVNYFPACSSDHTSIVSALQSVGAESSYAYRQTIAAKNGISNYSGTASQNTQMLNLLKAGKLIKP